MSPFASLTMLPNQACVIEEVEPFSGTLFGSERGAISALVGQQTGLFVFRR
jgi:hypothetical protein